MRLNAALIALVATACFLQAGSSNSLLDISPDGKKLAVVNTDNGTVSVVDLKTRRKLAEYPVGDHPEGVTWLGDTGTFLVTVYGDDVVRFYDQDKGHLFRVAVGDEPYGVVATKDGKRAYISHDYPGTISEIDTVTRKVLRTIPAGPGARGIAISNDEKTLYVTEFHTTKLLAIDIANGKVTDSWAGYESDNLARNVVLHPIRPKAYISHIRSRVTAFDARGSIFPQVAVADLWEPKDKEAKRRRTIPMDTFNNVYVVTNPWEAAISPDGKKLYTIYSGTNDMNVSKLVDDDFNEFERIGQAVQIGKHPRAIRVSADSSEVYIYNTLDQEVTIYNASMKKLASVKVCEPAQTKEWLRGKELFQTALQPMGGGRGVSWVACSSCHPDGLTDNRTWQNPEGNRKTPNLFGTAHTHPLHWSADRDESQDFEYTIRGQLMLGRGLTKDHLKSGKDTDRVALDQKMTGLSKDLDALANYTNSFPVRLSPHAVDGKLSAAAERGKVLFNNGTTECSKCHSGAYYSDSQLAKPYNLHDVGTGDGPREKMGPKFDTPTLLGVYRVGSYLHDGRAKTLHEVLTTHNKSDKHGKTSHLKKEELDDLVEFLKALPYETPPTDTKNTVKKDFTELKYPRPEDK
jgi:YVTN family beta-propeller protein